MTSAFSEDVFSEDVFSEDVFSEDVFSEDVFSEDSSTVPVGVVCVDGTWFVEVWFKLFVKSTVRDGT
ncbi:MAG: hypothetical protein HC800_25725 [Phormidesmis sp. RL_2_1]|nr:hypothetical protein [Phormidesmis sp. RL_2_1]